jgi:RNA polymerase sigma-70 factor (ECF subfamily)
VLDPDAVLRGDYGALPTSAPAEIRGAPAVAKQAVTFSHFAQFSRPVLVNGAVGLVTARNGQPLSVMAFTVVHGRITEIHILADPARLRQLDLA